MQSSDEKLVATSKSAADVRRRNAANEDQVVRSSAADDGPAVRKIAADDDQSFRRSATLKDKRRLVNFYG